jgi:subtilisin-like proprotein convertase family protein
MRMPTKTISLAVLGLAGLVAGPHGASATEASCLASSGTNCSAQIPDGPQAGVTSTFTVPALACSTGIRGIGIKVNISHSFIGDLRITVTNPAAQTATLINGLLSPPSSACPGDDMVVEFQDSAAAPVCLASAVPALSGAASPVTPLTGYQNSIPGTWSLTVTDLVNGNNGLLNDWSVDAICNPLPVPATTSPGLFVLIGLMLAAVATRLSRRVV